ncbi:DNA glycosylase [Entophlyctis helioformis]|nr:DNA glycosylase [Entophlyctis helioformis]
MRVTRSATRKRQADAAEPAPVAKPAKPDKRAKPTKPTKPAKTAAGQPPALQQQQNHHQQQPSITTEQQYKAALSHLSSRDPKLAHIIAHCPTHIWSFPPQLPPIDPFKSLARAIIFQQLNGKAAQTIMSRFVSKLCGTDTDTDTDADSDTAAFPTPAQVMACSVDDLRSVGLSARKTEYIRDLAAKCADGTISMDVMATLSDGDLRSLLCSVKGIGPWTVDMFLMMQLRRPDVLPTGDLGVRRGMCQHFGLKAAGKDYNVGDAVLKKHAEIWEPYRTLGSFYMWQFQDMTLPPYEEDK